MWGRIGSIHHPVEQWSGVAMWCDCNGYECHVVVIDEFANLFAAVCDLALFVSFSLATKLFSFLPLSNAGANCCEQFEEREASQVLT